MCMEAPERLPYPWQHEYREALVEIDAKRLAERIATAERIIDGRKKVLAVEPHYGREWQALEDAVVSLTVLRRELSNTVEQG